MFNPLDIGSFDNFLAMELESEVEARHRKSAIDHAIAEAWERDVVDDFDETNEIFHIFGLDLNTMSEDEYKYVKNNLH